MNVIKDIEYYDCYYHKIFELQTIARAKKVRREMQEGNQGWE
jgi:hypothetical protein